MSVIIQHKRGTATQWTTLNPTLAAGEVGWESDTNKFKIGTGSTDWNTLLYATLTPVQLSATYAKLVGGNAFTDAQTITSTAIGQVPLSIIPFTGQTASTFRVRNSTNSADLMSIDSSGQIRTTTILNPNSFNNSRLQMQDTGILMDTGITSNIPLAVRGSNGQTADLQRWQSWNGSTASTVNKIDYLGKIFVPGGTTIYDYAVESGGSTDTAWKKLIEVTCPTGLYTGASYQVDVVDNFDNYGIVGSSNVPQTFRFYVKITRSMGVQDDVLAAVVLGPSVNYVRVVKTSSSLYEIQVRQPDVYRVVSFMARRIVHNNTTESYNPSGKTYLGLSNGSTTGTIYVPVNDSATFSNFVVENFSQLSSNRLFVQPITGSTNATVPVTIRGASGQTGNLQDWQSWNGSTPTTLASIDSSGRFNSTTAGNFGGISVGLAFLGVQTSANTWGLAVRGGALQVNHLSVLLNSSGTTLGGDNANGQLFSGSTQPLTVGAGGGINGVSANGTTVTISTTNAHNLSNGDRVTIAGLTPAGYNGTYIISGVGTFSFNIANTTTGTATGSGTVVVDAQASITSRSAGTVGLLVRSAASQVVNPFEVQNSSGTVIANVSSSGGVRATGTLQGATLSAVSDGSTVATLSSSGNIQFGGAASYGSGVGVIGIANATTAPTTSPTGGGILFVNSGALQYRGTSGANATLVNADGTTPYLGLGSSYFAGHNPEGRLMYNTYLTNDMANARLRGSAVAATQNGVAYSISNANWDAMFDGTATFFNISPTSGFTFPLVITVPLPRTLTYGASVGLSFGSTTFRANSVQIEVFSLDSSSWVSIFNTTSNTSEDIVAVVSGLTNSNATGINQVRYTISAPNSTQLRLQHLWAYNFNSDMWSQTMMPRAGGSFYGPISATTVSDAVVMSVRGAASGGASIQTQDLQRWQTWDGTTTTTRARIDSGGNLKATNLATLNSIAQMAEANSGALLVMGRATAQTSSPGLNNGTLYFRDGTTSGTLRLATRTGASGVEETIVDNLSSTGSTAGAQFTGAGGVRTAGLINTNSSQYGNTILFAAPASTTYYLLATLPTSSAGTYDHLQIDGIGGGWGSGDYSTYSFTFANRNAFSYKYELSNRNVMANFKLRAYSQVDGSVQIWASGEASQFLKFAYNISSAQNITTVANPVSTTTAPSGTVVFDSSNVATYPPVQSIYGGISIFGTTTGTVPMLVQGVSGQTADLVKIQNNTPTDLFAISSAGLITAKVVSNAANQSRGIMLSNTSDLWQSGLYLKSDGSGNPRLTLLAPTGALGEAIAIDSAAKVGIGIVDPPAQLTVVSALSTRIASIVRGASGQSVNIQEWQANGPTTIASVSQTGKGTFDTLNAPNGAFFGNITSQPGNGAYLAVQGYAAGHRPLLVRGFGATTANLTDYQNGSGVVVGGRNGVGQIFTGSTAPLAFGVGGATTATSGDGTTATITTTSAHGLAVGDIVTIAGITPTGYNGAGSVASTPTTTSFTYANTTTGSQTVAGTVSIAPQLGVVSRSAGTIGAVVRGATSQSSDLLVAQNSAASTLFSVASTGAIYTGSTLFTTAQTYIYGAADYGAALNVQTRATGSQGIIVRGRSGQTVDLQQWQTDTPTTVASISSTGVLTAAGITLPSQTANTFFVAPDSAAGTPSFRVLSYKDIYPAGLPGTFGQVIQYAPVGGGMSWSTQVPVYPATAATFTNLITFSAGASLSGASSPLSTNGSVGSTGQVLSSAGAGASPTWRSGPVDGTTSTSTTGFGFMGLPQNSTTTGAYTVVAADAGKHIYASATRTVTIDSNTNLALPIGTTLTFIAGSGATMTIAITSDTMYLAGSGTTGSRTLAPFGMATAVKLTSTTWIISGNGLT